MHSLDTVCAISGGLLKSKVDICTMWIICLEHSELLGIETLLDRMFQINDVIFILSISTTVTKDCIILIRLRFKMFPAESNTRMKQELMQKANPFVSNELKQCKYISLFQKNVN